CIFRSILTTCSGDVDHFFPMMLTTPFYGDISLSRDLIPVILTTVNPTVLTISVRGVNIARMT
ncbi:hypothetical protein, partial [Algoriphagus antarcticus]|uniref:hypothetical protein n=1 Tax=Algoriphagus antarcticus TaxID=238540 RepID=UPI001B867859